jgi:V8-like Glu-specific endopeptidase
MRPILVLLLLGACKAGTIEAPPEGTAQPIIGGVADSGDPAVGLLSAWNGNEGWYCTATLIAPKVLLTAAHCVYDAVSTTQMQVTFGRSDQNATWSNVASWAHHPQYVNDRFYDGYDVAVLVLAQASSTAPKPYSHTAPDASWEGGAVRLVGYGDDDGANGTGAGTKRQTTTTFNDFTPFLIEVGQTGHTTCQGDSGGPTFRSIGGAETVIGVTSFGEPGCTNGGSMSRVDAYTDWIDAQVAANGGGGNSGGGGNKGGGGGGATANPPDCPWEHEDNGATTRANTLCDGSIYGTIATPDDVDWFTWTVPPNRTYTIGLSEPLGYDMVLYKLDGGTMRLVANSDSNGNYHEIARTTATGGTYFLAVWSASGSASDSDGYSLTVDIR